MQDNNENQKKTGQSLSDQDIETSADIPRRSFLRLTGVRLVGVAALASGCVPAQPAPAPRPGPVYTGLTDSDVGQFADAVGYGAGSGITDSDAGAYADPVGNGRGVAGGSFTDGDAGTYADPAGQGRSGVRTGRSDSDAGQWADMPGGGRWNSGLTDSDSGPYIQDQVGHGRRGF